LRNRGSDVELIAQSLLEQLNNAHQTSKSFPQEVIDAMLAHDWPGNVRELKNYVQRAYILADEPRIDAPAAALHMASTKPASTPVVSVPVGVSLADADRQLILATLEQFGGVKKHAAEILGISLKTLYNRLGEYSVQGLLPAEFGSEAHELADMN